MFESRSCNGYMYSWSFLHPKWINEGKHIKSDWKDWTLQVICKTVIYPSIHTSFKKSKSSYVLVHDLWAFPEPKLWDGKPSTFRSWGWTGGSWYSR